MLVHPSMPMLEKPPWPEGWATAALGDPRAKGASADLAKPSGAAKVAQSSASACSGAANQVFSGTSPFLTKEERPRQREGEEVQKNIQQKDKTR